MSTPQYCCHEVLKCVVFCQLCCFNVYNYVEYAPFQLISMHGPLETNICFKN